MTLSLPRPTKSAAVFAALAYTTLTFGAALTPAPAQAATGESYYRAELASVVQGTETQRPITSGLLWKCAGSTCTAGEATSRPAIVCARIAKEVGPLTGFAAKGKAFDADQLAKCNAA